jgi:hypothetical protein
MPDSADPGSGVRIDRLILEVPGLTAADAPALAGAIGRRIAELGLTGERSAAHVLLDDSAENVVERIAAALRAEFSR